MCEYSSRVEHELTLAPLAAWHRAVTGEQLFDARSDHHTALRVGEFGVATSGEVWVAIGAQLAF